MDTSDPKSPPRCINWNRNQLKEQNIPEFEWLSSSLFDGPPDSTISSEGKPESSTTGTDDPVVLTKTGGDDESSTDFALSSMPLEDSRFSLIH